MRLSGLVVVAILACGCSSPTMLALTYWDGQTVEVGAEFAENLHTHDAEVYELSGGARVIANIDGVEHELPRSSETGLGTLMAPIYKIDLPLAAMPVKITVSVTGDDIPEATMRLPPPFELSAVSSSVSRSQPFPGIHIEPALDTSRAFFQVSGSCLTNGTVGDLLDDLEPVMDQLDAEGSCDLTLEVSTSLDTSSAGNTSSGVQRRSVTFTSTP